MLAEVERFTGADAEQEDDITMVTLQRSAAVVLRRVRHPERGRQRARARWSGSSRRCAALRIDQRRLDSLKTAVAEATMNAIEHGNEYRRRPAGDAPRALRPRQRCACRSPTAARPRAGREPEAPDLETKLAGEQRPRGWGLFLIENLVDEAHVTNVGGTHTLELVLRLEGDDDGDA